jgi:hypothetical protein
LSSTDYILPLYAYLTTLTTALSPSLTFALSVLQRLFYTLISDPSPSTILVSLLVLATSILALRTFLRYLIAQVQLAFWLSVYAGVLGTAVWLWLRGPAGVWEDASNLVAFWQEQYGIYEDGWQQRGRHRVASQYRVYDSQRKGDKRSGWF